MADLIAARDRLAADVYEHALRPVLFGLGGGDAEVAHERTLEGLALVGRLQGLHPLVRAVLGSPDSPVEAFGLRFRNRVGLAAGVDKNALALPAWPLLGLGHVEMGTVTAQAQPGNDRPRLFRAVASEGIVNRMGFNNLGAPALAGRLRAVRATHGALDCVVGVSLGKTKVTPVGEATADYLSSLEVLDGLADYVAVNVSSPNTPGLRGLQDAGPLRELLTALTARAGEMAAARGERAMPVLVKIAPDLDDPGLDEALEVATASGVAGVIATNTTLRRDGLASSDLHLADEAGGLSGAPLTARAREVVARVAGQTSLPVIGVGGVMSADDGLALLDAGATLVQVYSGLIYRGPALVGALNRAVAARG